jgi:predicted transcriptional regulator
MNMRLPISDELRQALAQQPDGIEVEDQQTRKVYVLTDAELHRRAMQALHKQEDRDAIRAGIEDMEAGRVVPYEQVSRNLRAHLREKFGLPLGDA